MFGQITKESGTGAGPNQSRYLHYDHLGSIAAISDATGTVVERLAYDPWGKRRSSNGVADPLDALVGVNTDRGCTLHEPIDEVGVINTNGRVYDPLTGRFVSADAINPDPLDLKSFNRYSYVRNNPLLFVDPTGHIEEHNDNAAAESLAEVQRDNWGIPSAPTPKPTPEPQKSLFERIADFSSKTGAEALHNSQSLPAAGVIVSGGTRTAIASGKTTKASANMVPALKEIKEGIYEFLEDGNVYVGQSGRLLSRPMDHFRSGKLTEEALSTVTVTEVQGGRIARTVAEHNRIQSVTGGYLLVCLTKSQILLTQLAPIAPSAKK